MNTPRYTAGITTQHWRFDDLPPYNDPMETFRKVFDKYMEDKEKFVKEQLMKHFGTLDTEFLKSRANVKRYPTVEEWYDGETLIFRIATPPQFIVNEIK